MPTVRINTLDPDGKIREADLPTLTASDVGADPAGTAAALALVFGA